MGVAIAAPQTPDGSDIHLGDVMISTAVIQHDFGRQYSDSFKRKSEVESTQVTRRLTANIDSYNQDATKKSAYPGAEEDFLFPSEYWHKHRDLQVCEIYKEWYCMVPCARGLRRLAVMSSDVTNRHAA